MALLGGITFLLACACVGIILGTLIAQLAPHLLPIVFKIWDSFVLMVYNMLKRFGKVK